MEAKRRLEPSTQALVNDLPFTIRDYIFEEVIGRGSFSVVFKCRHVGNSLEFAAKCVSTEYESENHTVNVYRSEYSALSRLNHPNVIKLYDCFEERDHRFMILQLCSNGSLKDMIKPRRGMNKSLLLPFMKQLLEAVAFAHSRHVAHRDIKPPNVFIDLFERPVLADFGLSLVSEPGTLSEQYCGSFHYRSPESLRQQPHCPFKADIWALGVVFYEMACGSSPWPCHSRELLHGAIVSGDYQIPRYVDKRVADTIRKMMVIDPNARPMARDILKSSFFDSNPMGNQIVCPSGQNWYLDDFESLNFKIEGSLFDGTFSLSFRVTAQTKDNELVVKAYKTVGKQSFEAAKKYYQMFATVSQSDHELLFGNLVSLPHRSEEGAFLARPYMDSPLSERILFDPPFESCEKKWIAYQILRAVENLSKLEFMHGDIKPENVFVSDSLYVQLVDHAPFKPAQIGPNQPHHFIHFFSYFRSCCYLAPERISNEKKEIDWFAADIFSAACVVAFLYLNGRYLFNFTTVQQPNYDNELMQLDSIDDDGVRELLKKLIVRDPNERLQAFANWHTYFPAWFDEFYLLFCKTQISVGGQVALVGSAPTVKELIPSDERAYNLLFLNAAVCSMMKRVSELTVSAIIEIVVDFANRLVDPFLKLSRAVTYLLSLLSHSNTFVSVTLYDGILEILRGIDDIPTSMETFMSDYFFPHFLQSLDGCWKVNVMGRIPFLLKEAGRIWPDVLCGLHMKIFQQYSTDQEVIAFVRAFVHGVLSIDEVISYPLFDCFYSIMQASLRLREILPEVLEFIKWSYLHISRASQIRFVREKLRPLISELTEMLEYCTRDVRLAILSFMAFVLEKGMLKKGILPEFVQVVKMMLGDDDMSTIVEVRKILKYFPERMKVCAAGCAVRGMIDKPLTDNRAKIDTSVLPEPSPYPNRVKDEVQNDSVFHGGFILGEKVLDDFIGNVFANVNERMIVQHGSSWLSVIALSWDRTPKMSIARTTNMYKNIRFVNKLNEERLLVTTEDSVCLLSPVLDMIGSFEIDRPFSIVESFHDNRVLTVHEDESVLQLREFCDFRTVNKFDLGPNYPISVSNWKDMPISVVGTENNLVYSIDMRTNCMMNLCTFRSPYKIVTFPNSVTFAMLSDREIQFYDPRINSSFLKVHGKAELALEYQNKLIVLNEGGTFLIDPNAKHKVKALFDSRANATIPEIRENDDVRYELPTQYRTSLHGHMFQTTAVDSDPAKSLCISADCAGYVHIWTPKWRNKRHFAP